MWRKENEIIIKISELNKEKKFFPTANSLIENLVLKNRYEKKSRKIELIKKSPKDGK